ncbi:MAG: HAMP domain-containing histidine kinase [Clostridia bacterium]|nr:HAMP domain-containing histidine kinase [Clostridia bacterium]
MKIRQKLSINTIMILAVFCIISIAAMLTLVGMIIYSNFLKDDLSGFRTMPLLITLLTVCAVIGTLISIPVNRFFIVPIRKLADATKKVAAGDFTVRVPDANTSNELGALVDGFNSMVGELGNTELFRMDFISNFSHEFKTPITSIRGFAKELLYDAHITEEQRREYLTIIADEAERLSNMATDVLLLTNLEHTQYVSTTRSFSLDEQIRRSLLLLEKSWTEKELEPDIELESINYNFDEELMSHLWINLLSNAVKFSPVGGRLGVSLKREADCINVTVSDEGCGIPAENIDRIFDRFYQADSSHKSEGNGLGLTLCRRIAELCGGRITVRSELGRGTEFKVTLPVKAEEPKKARHGRKLKND